MVNRSCRNNYKGFDSTLAPWFSMSVIVETVPPVSPENVEVMSILHDGSEWWKLVGGLISISCGSEDAMRKCKMIREVSTECRIRCGSSRSKCNAIDVVPARRATLAMEVTKRMEENAIASRYNTVVSGLISLLHCFTPIHMVRKITTNSIPSTSA